tara:strand:- start:635 stop:2107 length:1473 start_codon:yes stop_codon:yes gene_type:complete
MSKYDIIIIGGGHNGLVCASYLAKKNYKTLILEKNNELGGMANCADFANSFSKKIISDLNIKVPNLNKTSYIIGLNPDSKHTILEENTNGIIFHDTSATKENQETFKYLLNKYKRFSSSLGKFMNHMPPRIKSGQMQDTLQLMKMAWNIRKLGKQNMREFLRVIGLNIADELEDNLSDDILKGILSHEAVLGTNLGPRSPGTVLTLLYKQAINSGSVFISEKYNTNDVILSLERVCLDLGVEIRKNSFVNKIITNNNSVIGVELENKEQINANIIVSNADPKKTYFELLGPEPLDTDFIRRAKNFRAKGNVAKLTLTLNEKPLVNNVDKEISNARYIYAPDINYVEKSFNASKYNKFSENLCFEFYILDNQIKANINYIPYINNSTHDKEKIIQQFKNTLKKFISNLNIENTELLTPNDISDKYNITGGHWNHGEFEIDQMLMMRPFYGSAQYQTPLKNLYLCSAGTHPGGGITGINGQNAAKKIIEDYR